MRTLKILKQLVIKDSLANIEGDEVFLKQGDMDGACGPYCVCISLLIQGLENRSTITSLDYIKGNTGFGKLLKKMNNVNDGGALIRNGTYTSDIEEMLTAGRKTKIDIESLDGIKGKELISKIINSIEEDAPVVFGIRTKEWGHWVVATGIEYEYDVPKKIMILEPSGDKPRLAAWNGAIDLEAKGGPYPYEFIGSYGEPFRVKLEDGVKIQNKA